MTDEEFERAPLVGRQELVQEPHVPCFGSGSPETHLLTTESAQRREKL